MARKEIKILFIYLFISAVVRPVFLEASMLEKKMEKN